MKVIVLHSSQDGIINAVYQTCENFDILKNELAKEFLTQKLKEDISIQYKKSRYDDRGGVYGWTKSDVEKYCIEHHKYCEKSYDRKCRCPIFEPITQDIINGPDVYYHATHLDGFIQYLENKQALITLQFETLPN